MKKPYPLFNLQLLQNKLNMQANLTKAQFNQYTTIIKKWLTVLDKKNTEKDLQQSFLTDFFVTMLGYTAQVDSEHKTLWWETKTATDGKKPDGVLGFNVTAQNADIRAVIELKAGNIDLDKPQNRKNFTGSPVDQAFNYGYSTGGACEFVIVSNFKTIRLYKNGDKSKYHQFILSEMATDNQKIAEFVYLLKFGNLFTVNNNSSVVHSLNTETGKNIANAFYKEYNNIRYQTWQSLIKSNKNKSYGPNFYLYMAQQLIDRIIFIRFCKENNALNNYALEETLSYNKLVKGKYNRLKLFFTAMDQGNPELNIAKFNGGLFAPDQDLDNLEIDDEIIDKIITLYSYNFSSDLDVNILGHIFEQSITDLEALTNNKTTQQRKKDGVFYTPPEITKYIVTNTINNWLTYKSQSITAPKDSKQWWQQYANILKNITVVDPSCGSGAFLVEVFNYLQQKWQKIHNQNIATDYTYQDILTNNIYGVDINPAAVGIAKLSLWLKTAHHKQPLTSLDNNIKIGNSLIDIELSAGYYIYNQGKHEYKEEDNERLLNFNQNTETNNNKISLAFNWHTEFANVFANGGFDIVVGNPPYVRQEKIKEQKSTLKNIYIYVYNSSADLYCYFYELSTNKLLKPNGFLGFITSNTWMRTQYGANLRHYILQNTKITNFIDLGGQKIFKDAVVDSNIIIYQKTKCTNYSFIAGTSLQANTSFSVNNLNINNFNINSNTVSVAIKQKIEKIGTPLKDWDVQIKRGILTGYNNAFIIDAEKRQKILDKCSSIEEKEATEQIIQPVLRGKDIKRYSFNWCNLYLINTHNGYTNANNQKIDYINIDKYPAVYNYLLPFKKQLETRTDKGRHWYSLRNCAYLADFNKPKIIFPAIMTNMSKFYYDNENYLTMAPASLLTGKYLEYIQCILNSKFMYYCLQLFYIGGGIKDEVKINRLALLPIPKISKTEQKPFVDLCTNITNLNQMLQAQHNQMLQLLETYGVTNITNNLKQWYLLNSQQFFAEITKQNKNFTGVLSKVNNNQTFMQYFTEQQQNIKNLQHQINTTDNQIDTMVYNLYNLSKQEIAEVEQYLTNHKKETN